MTEKQKQFALDISEVAEEVRRNMWSAQWLAQGNSPAPDRLFKTGMEKADELVALLDDHLNPQQYFQNPHHSGWVADDERDATACPHCGNENTGEGPYDSEQRCDQCGLWDLDDTDAKRFRMREIIRENLDNGEIDDLFRFLIVEVLG